MEQDSNGFSIGEAVAAFLLINLGAVLIAYATLVNP